MTFTVCGVKIKVEFLFTATVALLTLIDTLGVVWMSFFAVAVHELGHILAMLALRIKIKQISLSSCGVLIKSECNFDFAKAISVAAAGPTANFICALLITDRTVGNVMLLTGIFNLIPVHGTDGGDIFTLVCRRIFGMSKADWMFTAVSTLFALVIAAAGLYLLVYCKNPTMLAAAVYFFTMTVASVI